jgi:transposase InsO family protein
VPATALGDKSTYQFFADHRGSTANVLQSQFAVPTANTAWVSNITYIATAEGWMHLLLHSDRGVQYCAETFFSSLKMELGGSRILTTREQARRCGSTAGDHRIHRGVLQPTQAAPVLGLPYPGGV